MHPPTCRRISSSVCNELWWVKVIFNAAMFVSLLAPCDIPATRAAFMDAIPIPGRARFGFGTARSRAAHLVVTQSLEPGAVQNAFTTVFLAVPLNSMGTREKYKAEQLARWEDFSRPAFELVGR
ncbi:hypothetical protein DFH09DRAFT_1330217 [Mycena vulgaris]|nr:hypothetical protein DFH09DRAFT_1330217 [Mycena vulgaris]